MKFSAYDFPDLFILRGKAWRLPRMKRQPVTKGKAYGKATKK